MSKISKQNVEHIARLARIEVSVQEKESFTKEIGEILSYVDDLSSANTQNIEQIGQITSLENVTREDKVTNPIKRELLLQNAPDQENGFIKVKKVFD